MDQLKLGFRNVNVKKFPCKVLTKKIPRKSNILLFLDQIFQKTQSFSTTRDHLETTLTKFGPYFKIEMNFKYKGPPSVGHSNIFRIGFGGKDINVKGTRYPSLFINPNKYFLFSIHLDDEHHVKYHNLQESNTYHIIIEQKLIDCKWTFRIFVDSIMIDSTENTEPMVLDEAKLYLSAPWNPTANVEITHLKIEY